MREFTNEPFLDFSKPDLRAAQEAALAAFRSVDCPVVVGGERFTTKDTIVRANPCRPNEVVGRASRAPKELAEQAILTAARAFESWSRTPAATRAEVLFRAAQIMRERRFELNATLILEVSKSWGEADADTAEAIDFCEFYGREMLRYDAMNPVTPVPRERNQAFYLPLGVGIVIAPWNFPCAILTGMATAAVVAGNTVVMKPASSAPVIAYRVMEILEAAGLPPGVVNYVPCSGGEVGDALVDHRRTRFVCFTGSREVGVRIYERAAKVHPGQIWLKRVVAEMGGKDAIVVDEDADLDAAASDVVASAFGFQGQKCSACSRLVATAPVYDRLLNLVVEKTKVLRLGDVRDPVHTVGAVADESQFRKIQEYIEVGKKEGRLVHGGGTRGPGHFVEPTIFADVSPRARIAQEEIFGPVLAVIPAKDFEDALRIANDTEYGLTGALFCRNRDHLERARREFHVGNLYFNRKCTGALVGAHPFGGFNMSGTDSKAGGRDYLLLFLQSKSVSERIS